MKLCSRMMLIGCVCIAVLALSTRATYGQTEACCLANGDCQDMLAISCTTLMPPGTPQGPGTTCAPLEACCLPDGTCIDTSPACCTAAGGTPQGAASVCDGSVEACCLLDDTCIMADTLCCTAQGGTPQGIGSTCTDLVACCLPDGSCQDLDPLCCVAIGGRAGQLGSACQGDNNGNNIDDACEEIVPAVSDYGLVALLLLTAVAGVVVIRRARRGHAAA